METIIILGVVTVLFIITWIVIGVNATPYYPPMPDLRPLGDRFQNSYEYSSMKTNIDSCIRRLHEMELENYKNRLNPIFETQETTIKKLPTKTLLEEVKKRGLIETKEVLK